MPRLDSTGERYRSRYRAVSTTVPALRLKMLGAAILLIVQTSTGMVVNLYARIPSNPDSSQRRIFAVRSTRAFRPCRHERRRSLKSGERPGLYQRDRPHHHIFSQELPAATGAQRPAGPGTSPDRAGSLVRYSP